MEERRAWTTEGKKGRRRESDREASGEGFEDGGLGGWVLGGWGLGGGGWGDWMESENLSAYAEIKSPINMHHVLPRER